MSIQTNNVASVFAVETKHSARAVGRRIGLTLAAATLAGTALNPVAAQVFDVNGMVVTTTDFSALPGGLPVQILNNAVANGTLLVDAAGNLAFGGNLTDGAGVLSLEKIGTGSLTLTGANGYTGGTNIGAGRVEISSGAALGIGDVTVADGTTLAVGVPLAGTVMALSQSINIANRGAFTLALQGDPLSFFVDELTGIPVFDGTNLTLTGNISGGTLNITGGGAVRLQGNNSQSGTFVDRSVVFAATANPFGNGAIRVNEGAIFADGAAALTLAQDIVVSGLFYVNGPQDVTLNGTLSNLGAGANELGSLVKFGGGSLRLNGDSSINNVRLQDGRLIVGHNGALGEQGLDTANAAGTARTLQAGAEDLVLQNEISLVGPLSVDTAGQTLTLTGQIFNTGSLVKTGAGNLILSGNNIYSGTTSINAGTVTAGSNTAFSTSLVTMAGGTVLSNALGADTQRTLANNFVLGNVSIDSAGNLFQLSGVLNGAGTVTKTGAGTLRLTGNSANTVTGFTGTIDVQAGTLDLNGSIAGGITVQDGGSLVGTGSAAGTVTLNETSVLAPGNSAGTLTFGDLVLANGTSLNFELAGIAAVPGTDADLINITSNLTLDGVLNITSLAGFNVGVGNRTLLTYGNLVANNGLTVSNAPPVDVTYTILAGPVASGAGIVQLNVAFNGTYRWNGANLVPNAAINGGSGTFSLTNTNFTNSDGSFSLAYGNNAADDIEFGGAAGNVDVASAINFDQMGFVTSGYVLGGAGSLNVNNSSINVSGSAATINTVIAGINGLTKSGAGDLALTNSNSYAGGTALQAGSITVGSNTALSGGALTMTGGTGLNAGAANLALDNAVTTLGVGTVNTNAFTLTLSGVVDGAGSILKTGSGNLILSGNNGYRGGTALTEGSLTITNNNSIGTGTLTTTGGTSVIVGTATGVNAAVTLANAVSLGAGTTTVNLQGSSLSFNNDASIVTNGASLTLNAVVSGAGALATGNLGTVTLNGNNSYSGGTFINTRSVVYVGTDTAVGTGTVTTGGATGLYNISGATRTLANAFVLNGGTWLGGTSDLVLNGAISGAGFVIKAGAQTLILNNDNSFAGTSQLRDGRIMVGTGTALGTGALRVFAPTVAPAPVAGLATTLTAGTNGLTLANAITLDAGSNLIVESDLASFTLAGVISGDGALTKARSGNLILTGDNSHIGGTTLIGGTITAGSNTALGSGRLTMTGGTTLASGAAELALVNAITTLGVGNVDTAGNIFTLNGVIDGAGSLSKINTGNLVLNGRNTFTGGSLINAGTVTVGTSTALGAGAVVMLDGTTLTPNTDGLAIANAFNIGNVTVATEAFTFTLDGPVGGSGLLTKTGSGTLVLNGSNAYGGGTALNAGTIRVGNSLALGTGAVAAAAGTTLQTGASGLTLANAIAMAGGMTVDNFANQMTLGGVLSGTGPLSVIDSTGGRTGVLTLSGENSYTGGTVVTGTTLSVSQNANLGNVAGGVTLVGGTLRTTASFATARNIVLGAGGGTLSVATGTTLTSNGVISGTSLTKNSGELVLNSANTYTGGTALNAGTITVGNNAALGTGALAMADGTTLNVAPVTGTGVALANTVSLAGVGTINTNPTLTLTLNGIVSGAGSVNKTGTGVLVLNGVNTYAGGTALNAGQITVGSNAALGTGTLTMAGGTTLVAGVTGLTTANNIVTLGAATINSGATPSAYTVSGVISGAGSVTKQGTGVLTVSAASTYTGATTVAAGTLNVTGSLVSAVTVNSAAALTGTGTVGALSVLAGGSVNPGAVGTANTATLNVTGAATLAGTYTVNVSTSAADRITAGGALTLGGTLAVVPTVPATFNQFNQLFTVASGATRTGTFATSTGLDQFGIAFAPVVEYTATAANIRLAPQSLVTLGNRFGGVTGNALEVAQAFDRAVAANTSVQTFFNVYANGGNDLPRTLRQMSGEQRATERRVVLDSGRTIREAALDRLNGVVSMGGQQVSKADGDTSLTFWLRGAGSWGKAQPGEAATAFTTEQRGVLTGLDWKSNGLTLGGMFNYTSTNVEYQQLGGSSNVETVGGTLYAGYRKDGGLVVNAGASVAGSRANGARAITLPSFQQSLAGTTTGTTYQMFGELAWDLAASADTRIEPFARLSYVKADFGALAETGGVAALTAAKQGNDITITNLGMRFGANVASGKVALNASASWQGTTGDRDARTVIGIASIGQNSNIRSVLIDRSALSLQADAGVNLSDTIRFSLGYSGLIGKRNDDHGGRATLNFAF